MQFKRALRISTMATAALLLSYAGSASAAVVPFISWHTNTTVPTDYEGRPLPTQNSIITATLNVIEDGKAVNLDKEVVQWRAGTTFLSGEKGLSTISFPATKANSGLIRLTATVKGFRGAGNITGSTTVRLTAPSLVIDTRAIAPVFKPIGNVLRAYPYFFVENSTPLQYDWKIGSLTTPTTGALVVFDVASPSNSKQTRLGVTANAENPATGENATQYIYVQLPQ